MFTSAPNLAAAVVIAIVLLVIITLAVVVLVKYRRHVTGRIPAPGTGLKTDEQYYGLDSQL